MNPSQCDSVMKNSYNCRITLTAPAGKGHTLERILSPLTEWVDPSHQVITVEEKDPSVGITPGKKPKNLKVKDCLVTPALSVMLFMIESGSMCVKDAERVLKKPPWRFHHKVELQNKSAPNTALAKQEFYKLADDMPLFAACPVLTENEHFRISLYVHDFPAMVEFYRVVTDTEIETNKPEFCIFTLYQQPGLDIQLSLKRSQYIFPVPVESCYVSFNVKNIQLIKTNCDLQHAGENVYTTRDPDGNLVVLYETGYRPVNDETCCHSNQNCCCGGSSHLDCGLRRPAENLTSFDDMKSFRSLSEIDSGRFSDLEGAIADDADKVKVKGRKKIDLEVSDTGTVSDGYSSSLSSLTVKDNDVPVKEKSAPAKGKVGVKRGGSSRKVAPLNNVKSGKPEVKSKGKVAPLYI